MDTFPNFNVFLENTQQMGKKESSFDFILNRPKDAIDCRAEHSFLQKLRSCKCFFII